MAYEIEYKSSISRDLKKIDKSQIGRLLDRLEEALGEDPNAGSPLKGKYQGLYKYRVGDYRVIYAKTVEGVLVLRIGYQENVY